jgi:hypothetical protein
MQSDTIDNNSECSVNIRQHHQLNNRDYMINAAVVVAKRWGVRFRGSRWKAVNESLILCLIIHFSHTQYSHTFFNLPFSFINQRR